jgi:hypothetical protein
MGLVHSEVLQGGRSQEETMFLPEAAASVLTEAGGEKDI